MYTSSNLDLVLVFFSHERRQVEGSNSPRSLGPITTIASYLTTSPVLENQHYFNLGLLLLTKLIKGR